MVKIHINLKLLLLFLLTIVTHLFTSISNAYDYKIEAVIFDCDGVLVDTEYLKFVAWKEALASENIDFSIEEYKPLVGLDSKNILRRLKEIKHMDISEKVIELKNSKYRVLQKEGVPPISEMVAFVKYLAEEKKRLGIKVGLASSAPRKEIFQNLQQIGLENYFDLVISGSNDLDDYVDQEGKNKPKPYIYIEAAKRLNIPPTKCLVFEDTSSGVEAASSAGMTVIAVPNQFTSQQNFSKATKVIWSFANISLEDFLKISY